MEKFLKDFWPSMLVLGVILYATLSSDPLGADELPLFPGADKLAHAIMMGGLTGAVAFDIQRRDRAGRPLTPKLMWTLFACVAAFSAIDEIAQGAMGMGRAEDAWDFCADCFGSIIAVFSAPPAILAVLKIKRQPQN